MSKRVVIYSFVLLFIILLKISCNFPSNNIDLSTPGLHFNNDSSEITLMSVGNSDSINITLMSPMNNSIVKGGTEIQINFTDSNGSIVTPTTEFYRWDEGPNFENILRPLPLEDGSHILEVKVESESGIWSYSKFVFISDKKAPDIILNSPENFTYTASGEDIEIWSSSYPSGSLQSIDLADITGNNIPDILVGSSNGRMYTLNGRYGDALYSTIVYSAPITDIKVFNKSSCLIGLSDGVIRSINVTNGQTIWSNTTLTSSVVSIANDNVSKILYSLHEEALYAFNYSGYPIWSKNNTDYLYSQKILFLDNFFGDSNNEVISINQSSFVTIFNATTGNLILNYSLAIGTLEDAFIENNYLYLSSTNGSVYKYNVTNGVLNWSKNIATGQNIYQITSTNEGIVCSTGNGHLILLYDDNGSIMWDVTASSSYIKHLLVDDFDQDSLKEVLILDGNSFIKNFDCENGQLNWDYETSSVFNRFISEDLDSDTRTDVAIITNTGNVLVIDPRAKIPKLVPAWTNVSIDFDDEISGNITCWDKYSWDGDTNQTSPGSIPTSSGFHSLAVWVSDNASNIGYAKFQFFSLINVKLSSPNNTYQQSGTPINLTFSESPLEALYKWDDGTYQETLADIPVGEFGHDLYIFLMDQSYNRRDFHYFYTTDDTKIESITLLSPDNDSIVEGNETIDIQFSEIPYVEYYSWDGQDNSTVLSKVPLSSDTHILDVSVADSALNWKTARFIFHTKIMITLNSPQNNSIIDPFSFLNFSFGENPDTYQYQIDNLPIQTFTDHNISINFTLPSVSKTYRVSLSVNDSLNGRWNNEIYFFVAKILVNITSHIDGGFAETGDILHIYFSDIPATRIFSWDSEANSSRMPTVPGPDGTHYLDIYVGNIEGQFWHYHYSFFVDTDLIDILLLSPTNNTRINSWENISIEFSETPYLTQYQWDNNPISANFTTVPSVDGGHVLNITVFDEATNRNSKIFYWVVDDTPINIALNNTVNQSTIITGDYLAINFNNETPDLEWYRWDSGGYSPVLPPNPPSNGTHTLNVTVSDGLNWNTQIFAFNVTDLPPMVNISADIPYKSGSSLLITTSEDLTESWHQWDNGSKINGLIIKAPDAADGYHHLIVYGEDVGGSFTFVDIQILIDNTPIELLEIAPSNNSNVKGGENVSITFDETPYSITYSWGGERSYNITPVPKGVGETFTLNVRAYDEAGNLLDANIIYHVPSPEQKFIENIVPIIIIGLIATCLSGGVVYLKREFLKSLWNKGKEKFKLGFKIQE